MIPLNLFTDYSTPQSPKGRITTSGLTSPIRNPLYPNFSGQIAIDYRPRDFLDQWHNWDIGRYARLKPISGVEIPTLSYSENTGVTWATDEITSMRTTEVDYTSSASPYNCLTSKKLVMMAAFKVSEVLAANYSYLGFAATAAQAQLRFVQTISGTAAVRVRYSIPNVTAVWHSSNSTWNAGLSQDKWLLAQLIIDTDRTLTPRILGGQFYNGTTDVPLEGNAVTTADVSSYFVDRLEFPFTKGITLGMATAAIYTGNNTNGDGGLEIDDITWTLFDQNHTCNSISISGNQINFTTTGEVAWQVYVDGQWKNTDGGGSLVYYGTQDVQTSHQIDTYTFSALRPVLKNYGVMYADSNSVLNSAYVDTVSQGTGSTGVNNRTVDIRTYTGISFEKIASARYTEISSSFRNGLVEYQFRKTSIPSEKFIVRSDIDVSKHPQIKEISADSIKIELPERTNYQVRMRQNGGTWTEWVNFKTRQIDFDSPSQNSKTTIQKTKKGAKVINTDLGFSTVRSIKHTKRGAIVDNTKTDYNK